MLILKIDGKVHYINMGNVIEIYEDVRVSPLTNEKFTMLKIRLIDGSLLIITNKEEQDALYDFLEHFSNEGVEA